MNRNKITEILNGFLDTNTKINPLTDSSFHELTLFSLVTSMKAKTIVELGVRSGGTTLPLLLAAHVNGGTLYSVDLDQINYTPPNDLNDNWIKYSNTDAIEFLKNWPKDKVIDFIYVDDWHAYRHVKTELEIIDELVSPKSLIVAHDAMYGQCQPYYHSDLTLKEGQWAEGGPYRAIAELNQQFFEFSTIPVNNGLTIIRKKYSNKFHS